MDGIRSEAATGPFSLAGRTALVTGSTTGLGKAIARALASAGAQVALNYFNNTIRAERSFTEFQAAGGRGMLVRADATQPSDVERMVREVNRDLAPIDILVLNATCDQPQKSVEEYDWDFFQLMVDFFIKSPFLLTRACL